MAFKILYIHGANSTSRSFNYMKRELPSHDGVFFDYTSRSRVADSIALAQELHDAEQPDAVIGHSLGGLITCHLKTNARRVAIATPFGGSMMANFFPMWSQLMRDVATTSPVVAHFRHHDVIGPTLVLVAQGLHDEGHDGVLTATSQQRVSGNEVVFSHHRLNHYEMMVDPDICEEIAKFIGLP